MGDMLKKILKVFIFCFVAVLFTYIFWSNPNLTNKIAASITDVVDQFASSEVVPYTKEFKVNELQISNSDYYYNKLTDTEKEIYDSLAASVANLESDAVVRKYEYLDMNTTMEQVSNSMNAFFNDHPEVFYLDTQYKVATTDGFFGTNLNVYLNYLVSNKSDLNEKLNEIKSKIDIIMSSVNSNSSDFEKELQIHDKLGDLTTYYRYKNEEDIPDECHTIYGTLITNKAVCDGFAKTLQIILNKVNIDTIFVTGSIDSEAHAWDMVKLDNEWYHLDLTSNKSLDENKTATNILIHSYFNVTTNNIKNTHTINNENQLPAANSIKYNYYIYKNKNITKNDSFDTKLKSILSTNTNANILEFSIDGVLDVANKVAKVLQSGNYTEYTSSSGNSFKYYNILNTYILQKQ